MSFDNAPLEVLVANEISKRQLLKTHPDLDALCASATEKIQILIVERASQGTTITQESLRADIKNIIDEIESCYNTYIDTAIKDISLDRLLSAVSYEKTSDAISLLMNTKLKEPTENKDYVQDSNIKLAAIRQALNLTTKALSEAIGVSDITLNAWENGARKPSDAARLLIDLIYNDLGLVFKIKQMILKNQASKLGKKDWGPTNRGMRMIHSTFVGPKRPVGRPAKRPKELIEKQRAYNQKHKEKQKSTDVKSPTKEN